MFSVKSPPDYAREVGHRLKALRLQRNLRQGDVARDAGVSAPTLSALENHGRGTLEALARVMYVLGREREFDALLLPDPPSTLEELSSPSSATPGQGRQRARRSSKSKRS